MNKMLHYCCLITIFFIGFNVSAQTIVYNNDFTAVSGFPPAGFTLSGASTDFTAGSTSGVSIGGTVGSLVLTANQLAPWVTVAVFPVGITNNGYAQATAPLSSYSAPFDPTLSANTQLVSWAFNMQTGKPATGFSDGRDNAAAVLVCDNSDIRNAGKGYAVTFDPLVPGGFQLINYSGGLLGTVVPIVSSGPLLAAPTNYASVKVVYDPTTNNWTLSLRDDGPGGFAIPTTGTLSSVGAAIDATYTGSPMSLFGFYANYSVKYTGSGPDAANAYFDNYSVRTICASITGGLETCIGGTTDLSHPLPGGTWVSVDPGVATIDLSSGLVTGVSADTVTVSYTSGTCFITDIVTVNPTVATPITGDTMLCRTEASLLSTASPGGTWANYHTTLGTIDAAGNYTSLLAGIDTVTYDLGPGCVVQRTVRIDSSEVTTGTASVCAGSTTQMANSIAGGTWLSSDLSVFSVTGTGGLVTGVAPVTATLVYTNPYGCQSSTVITVNALPAAITGNLVTCVGSTTALASTPAVGVWNSDATATATVNVVTGVVTGISIGTSGITYTNFTTGCLRSVVVTVNAAPSAISGTMTVCSGSSVPLSHGTSGGTWSSSDLAVATVNASGSVTGTAAGGGTATITYTLPVSNCFATATVTVLAIPNAITGSPSVCVGATTTLNTTTGGATWSSLNTAIATVNVSSGVVSGNTSGTATIVCTSPNGCSRTVVVTVNVVPTAVTGTATLCAGSTTTLSSTPTGGTWSSSNVAIATVSGGGVVTGNTGGTANITYDRNGCIATRTITVNALPTPFTGAGTVCEGATVALNSTPIGGTWASSDAAIASVVTGTGLVTGISGGTASITYTAPVTSCQRIRVETVNAAPAAIGGPTTLCPGFSATLTNASAPGTWTSSTPAVASIASGTGVYNGLTTGTSNITYTQTSTGCTSSVVVTIAPAPPALISSIGDTVLCPGDFVTLTVSTSPGVTYRWYNGGVMIPGAGSPTLLVSAAGTYNAQVFVTAGCSSTSSTMAVTVEPATATISIPGGTTTTCAGTPVVLNANTGAGLTYQWELAGTAIAGATGNIFNAGASGSYAVRVTNAAGCWALSTPVVVTATPAPSNVVAASGPLTICNGSTVTLTAAAGTGYTYQWYNSAGAIAGAVSMTYAAGTAESYYVTVTNTAGCTATSGLSVVAVNPTPSVAIAPTGVRIFCAGGSVLLNAASGFNYQWFRDGTVIAGATNSIYAATMSGGYRVMVTNTATGCSDMTHADTVVTVISTPAAIPLTPARFCWGGSSLLSTSVSGLGGAIDYQWFFNGAVIPGAIGNTYNANVSGDYYCSINVPGSCMVSTSNVSVSEVPLPDPLVGFNGTSVYTSSAYITWQWYKDLMPIAGATSASTPVTGNGNYKVAVTDTNGCQSVSATYVLTGWTGPVTNITDINNPEIRIFPTPTGGTVNVESPVEVRAVIYSMDGKSLINQPDAHVINLSDLADGLYMISLFDSNGQLLKTQKLIKQQ